MAEIGQYLKRCRQESGATQGDVSHYLGYDSKQLISNVERGLNSPPLKTILPWCKCVGASKQLVFKMMLSEQKAKLEKALKL